MQDTFEISRRGLLAGALGASGLLLPAGMAHADEPKQGGHFRIGVADFASSDVLDPTITNTQFQVNLEWQLRNNLAEVQAGGKVIPELAESWDASKDAKTWTFKLRKGVTFHNGKSLTPEDVVYSYRLHMKEGTKTPAKPIVAQVADIKADGDAVVFTLKDGNVSFPALTTYAALYIVPDGTTDFAKGVGTGGYTLENFQPGISSLVKRNPNYFKAGRAHFDSVEMIAMKDATARANALLTGKIDTYNAVDPKTVKLLDRNKQIKINSVTSKAHFCFAMLMNQAPFTDNDVRLAMKYAIDREDMVKRILNGYGSLGNDEPLSPAYPEYAALPQRAYDPDKAKFHLKKANQEGLKTQLYVSETPFAGATDAAVLYKEHAAKAGIEIEVVKTPEDGYWDNIWLKKPLCATRWSGRVNADVMLSLAYTEEGIKAGWNETNMNDPRVNKLVADARSEFDEAKRNDMYAEAQKIIHETGGANIFAFAALMDATISTVQNDGKLSGDWTLDGGRASERWWFA
ncbi:MAG TPA: ABC transporter substrate-binding protein [Lichenihabitans sp.]|jgi:peptide/nickel transport system substrate-binding protein|nr:ABC transporter substrate-binding protein [Lichenihabitans sp.]